ncbi:MAG: NADP-dependent phosphogluconate dehydrogenase, partial [Gammaproteobacteria bacterium]
LIAETYDLMARLLGLDDESLGRVYAQWNETELRGFLMEISADIFDQREPGDDRPLIDLILDVAHQKGTGAWTSQDAMDLEVAVPTIDAAVGMRALSVDRRRRGELSERLPDPAPDKDAAKGYDEQFIEHLRQALYTAMLLSYAQGLHLLRAADEHHGFGLKLEDVARIWRGGCIIRADLLEDLRALYKAEPKRVHPLDDQDFAQRVANGLPALREVVRRGSERGVPLPGLMSALAYLDAYRSAHLPANLIQAQRDYFGAHGIERVDREGQFHGHWNRAASG